MQPLSRLHGYIIPQKSGQFKFSVKNNLEDMGAGQMNILIKYIWTPPPQKSTKGRYAYYTVRNTPDTNNHTFYNNTPPPPFIFGWVSRSYPTTETPPVTFYFGFPLPPIYFSVTVRPLPIRFGAYDSTWTYVGTPCSFWSVQRAAKNSCG